MTSHEKRNQREEAVYETIRLTKQLSDSLRAISKETGSSLFSTLMSGFGVLMHKYSGEDDLNIGMPVAYRPHTQLEKVFGMFVNTVVVRLRYEKGSTFRELVRQTNEAAMNAIEFQDLPFENVVELVKPERIPGINPLFQVALAWQNNLNVPLKLDGIRSERVRLKEGASIFDLILYLWEKEDTIQGEIEYSADLLKQDTIIRLRDHFLDLLAKLADNPDSAVESLPMISDADKTLINTSNNTRTEYPGNMTVARLFEEQADLFREKTALVFKDDSLTYEELNGKANQLARTLRDAGVTNNSPVGIMADKSLEMIVGILAILKAGGGYVPVDPEYPLQRIHYILEDSGCKILLLQDKYNSLSPDNVHKINLNSPGDFSNSKSNIENINTSSDLAYIMYTSGTTGKPKGSMILQYSVLRLVRNTNYISLTPRDRILLTGAMVFDATTFEIWGALLNGATLYIVDKETILDPDALGAELDRNDISVLWLTSALFTQIAEVRTDIFRKLSYLLTGGDVLSAPHINKVRKANPGLKILNCYGPTENTTFSTTYLIDKDFDHNIPIGKPIANSTAHIFDRNMNLLPVGVIGELYVGGDGLSAGYLNSEELNRTRFMNNPLNPGEKLYRTGDLARWLPDGNIEFRGRIDNQLKIRGFRVELEEIEAVISEIDGVIETVVKPVKVAEGDFRLVAFLNVPESFNTETSQISSLIKTRLPAYMIPSAFRILNGFPKTINGKTDKKALSFDISEFETKPVQQKDTFTKTEKRLHAIWCETLKTEAISLTDDFFNTGGNSLSGIRLINKIRESFGVKLTFRELVANSTISLLGTLIDTRTGGSEKAIDLIHLPESGNLPLTRNQKRLWIIWKLQPDVPSYIIPATFRFSGPLNREILRKSIDLLFRRHHIMFSVIKEDNGEPFCELLIRDAEVQFHDYTGLPADQKEKLLHDLVNSDSMKPFDLEKGPLYRLFLIKTAEDEHYFHMTIHHIIFDGWSWGILVNDLSSIYNSLAAGKEPDLEKLEFQQYDYAHWEAASEENKDSVEFWEENLKGCSPVLNFPFDFPRRHQSSGKGGYENISLSRTLSKAIKQISKEEGSSLFSILLSSFGILLHKYSGEDDLNIGMPVAYRPHSGLEKIFGMFVNTVVVRLRYDKQDTFRHLIRKTNESAMNALSHQDIPFERVVEIAKPDRTSDANPLFQVDFAWQNNLGAPLNLDGIRTEKAKVKDRVSIFDLSLGLWEKGDFIEGEIDYNTDLISPETAVRLKNHFLILINNLVENIDVPVSSLSMISDEEEKIIIALNQTRTDYPKDKTPVHLFEEQVALRPDKTAVVFDKKTLTYKQLNERANQLARTLRAAGVTKNSPVGIMADKSLEMIVGIIAILKAGGGYVPVDPEYPEQRINFIIRDSGCKIILIQNDKSGKVTAGNITLLSLDSEISYNNDNSDLDRINVPSDLAYIIYTSGTTGKPKGTPIPQQGIVRLVCNTNYIDIKPEDRVLQSNAIVFDASVEETWGAFLNGATLYVIDKETLLDPVAFGDVLINNNISYVDLTSSLFAQIAESRTDIFRNVKNLVLGGDVLSAPHVNRVRKDNPGLVVVNTYGPTENSCNSTAYKVERDFDSNIPIGKPVSNTKAYIFDRNMNYQPVGVPGELYVGGDGLSQGYLNNEDLNKTSFIVNPYNPPERLYKTGDLARWLPDGNIEFRGRIDNQLKIRGFRVELEEIEAVISEIDGVIETVVKPVKVAEGDFRLVAFLNVPESFNTEPSQISSLIKTRLPAYMIPSAFRILNGFPKTSTGKIDRKALSIETGELEKRKGADLETLSITEKTIHRIWCEALKTDNLSITEDFFDAGGNSLLAIRLINKIREVFGIRMTFRELTDNSTIDQMSGLIDSHSGAVQEKISLVHLTEKQNLPLTHNQKRLWLISKLQPDIPSYIVPTTYRFRGSLDHELFEKSLDLLFHRHHVVFSVFRETDGEPYCDIVPSDLKIPFIDYSGLPENEKSARVNHLINEAAIKPFDLQNGPLFRLFLIKTAADEHYFHISLHHIIYDGWSHGVMVNDLGEIYNSLVNKKNIDLEELLFQQYDYAQWENNKNENAESVSFWKDNLKGCSPVLNFPYDMPRREKSSGKGFFETIQLTKDLSEKLRQISRTEDTSLFATMMGCFGILMHKYSGEDDINIGVPVAFRPHSSLEKIFGMFVNTVVVRLKYLKNDSFRNLIKGTGEAAMNAISHQDIPFERVVEIARPDRSSNANPLFQAAFVWQNNLGVPLNLQGVKCETVKVNERVSPFDITLSLWENKDIIEGEFNYNVDILTPETITRLKNNFLILLNNLADNSDAPISSLSMISDMEIKMIDAINHTSTDYPKHKTIAQLFEEKAVMFPDNLAIAYKDNSFTYKQLNEKANQLARTLRKLGVKPNSPVGLFSDKSLEMIIAILGILKAGGCYAPIDPEYPEQRINFIVKDSDIKILLTQEKYMETDIPGVQKINLNSEKSYSSDRSDLQCLSNPTDLAYILYTSGTTGTPKGTPVPQRGVVRMVCNTNYIEFTPDDHVLLSGAIVFDASTMEIWSALLNGGSLFITDREILLSPNALADQIEKNKITTLIITSALFTHLAEIRTDIFSKLKHLVVGGDVLSPAHVSKVRKNNPNLVFINAYGPTENSCTSTAYRIYHDHDHNIPIGKPISNSTAYIFDRFMNYQPVGVPGELCVGGDGLSPGYLNRKELNDKCFIEHPFIPGVKIYKTGDLARWLPDWNIEFLGRADNQLKIRGFRVELEEIESVLASVDGVIETVVKPVKLAEGDYRLSAFLNVPESFNTETSEIIRLIKTKLPSYMIPSAFKLMHGFPLTVNGKIDRNALSADIPVSESRIKTTIEDLSITEKTIFSIWCQALKTDDLSLNDNFFDIGGNSLMAVTVLSKIESAFNINLGLRTFFDSPRIKDLAENIDIKTKQPGEPKTDIHKDKSSLKIISGEI